MSSESLAEIEARIARLEGRPRGSGGSDMREMRRMVCRDAGIPTSVADGMIGENPDVCAEEALTWVRARRGEAGVREAREGFARANERESPDEIRARVASDLGLSYELKSQLSTATKTEAEIVDDGLALLKQSGGQAALDAGVRKLQGRAIDASIREWVRGTSRVVTSDDPNEILRAAAGINPAA